MNDPLDRTPDPDDVWIRIDGRVVRGARVTVTPRRFAVAAAAVALLVGTVALAAPGDAVPHTFTSGGVISAAQMNENFTEVTTQIGEVNTTATTLESNRLYVETLPTTGFSTSWTTNTSLDVMRVTRIGSNVEIWGRIDISGTPGPDETLTLQLPAGLTPATVARGFRLAGDVDYRVAGSGTWTGSVEPGAGPDQLVFYTLGTSDNRTGPVDGVSVPVTWTAGSFIAFRVVYPVEGWTPTGA